MRHCECCTKKAQLYEKLSVDLILLREWFQDVLTHSKKIGSNQSAAKKICIEVTVDKAVDHITAIVNNGRYNKFLGVCSNTDGEA